MLEFWTNFLPCWGGSLDVSPMVEALSLRRGSLRGRRLQILVEIRLSQFHQDVNAARPFVEYPRVDDAHYVLLLDKRVRFHCGECRGRHKTGVLYPNARPDA